jgi:putative solute:sodium symporter small subunit
MAGKTNGSIEYWRKNRRLISILLVVWALVSYVFGIMMAEPLAGIHIGHLPAGFWWAQQGSMYVFVVLIFIYAWRMDKLDREHDVHEEEN